MKKCGLEGEGEALCATWLASGLSFCAGGTDARAGDDFFGGAESGAEIAVRRTAEGRAAFSRDVRRGEDFRGPAPGEAGGRIEGTKRRGQTFFRK